MIDRGMDLNNNDAFKMIIMGAYHPVLDQIVASFHNIKVLYYIKDESVLDDNYFENFWTQYGATKAELKEEFLENVDMIFVCGYTKIIKSEMLNKYIFVNIHAGNLPKWRGTSANSWAIINGDYHIAYTLHRVTDILDGGPIYKKFEYTLNEGEMYGDARKHLEKMLASGLEETFCKICSREIEPLIQCGNYVYCPSFRKEDGVIQDWNITTRRIIDLYRVFGNPYGSGLFLCYKDKKYEIMDIFTDDKYDNYYCVPGAVVNIYGGDVFIKTKDSVIKIKNIKNEDGLVIKAENIFRIGNRL